MRWSYKTIHYELKKEGILGSAFLDEPEIELSLNQYGKAGWELVSLLETMDGLIAVFKQPLSLNPGSIASPSDVTERVVRPTKSQAGKTKAFAPTLEKRDESASLDEDVVEAMLLDEFEVVEDKADQPETKPSTPPVDIGMIRIE